LKPGLNSTILDIKGLSVSVDGNKILKGINLVVNPGEVHVLMGPNGSGKSTLANVLVGNPNYSITDGNIIYEQRDLLDMKPEERARAGIFLALQYPTEIPGVRLDHFIRASLNAIRKSRGIGEYDVLQFNKILKEKALEIEIAEEQLRRPVNEGFSGGEKKRNEILQLAVLEPKLAILDEPDSGLDVDSLRSVAIALNNLKRPDCAMILITHYQRILEYVVPDFVHILVDGQIVRSGGRELALEIEAQGYDWLAAI